jgi:hypothetical protein
MESSMNEAKQTFEKFSKPDEEVGEEGAEEAGEAEAEPRRD